MADWSKLPPDLIDIVAKKVKAIEDFLTFSCVCRSWRSSAPVENWTPGRQLPWLMLPEKNFEYHNTTESDYNDDMEESDEEDKYSETSFYSLHNTTDNDDIEMSNEEDKDGKRIFYSPYTKKHYRVDLPEAQGQRCWGSPHGWICMIGPDLQSHLLNPLTRSQICLPPLTGFGQRKSARIYHFYRFISKMVAFQNRSDGTFLVFAIYSSENYLAFARLGDKRWTLLDSGDDGDFEDVVRCSNGQIFAVGGIGIQYLCCDLYYDSPKAIHFPETLLDADCFCYVVYRFYLVASHSNGDSAVVWLVMRDRSDDPVGFQVWEFDFGTMLWRNLLDSDGGSLGGHAVFVGDNLSMILSTDEVGCEPDSVYFTDDHDHGMLGIGFFNGGPFHPICTSKDGVDMELFKYRPTPYSSIWIMPSIY